MLPDTVTTFGFCQLLQANNALHVLFCVKIEKFGDCIVSKVEIVINSIVV